MKKKLPIILALLMFVVSLSGCGASYKKFMGEHEFGESRNQYSAREHGACVYGHIFLENYGGFDDDGKLTSITYEDLKFDDDKKDQYDNCVEDIKEELLKDYKSAKITTSTRKINTESTDTTYNITTTCMEVYLCNDTVHVMFECDWWDDTDNDKFDRGYVKFSISKN